MRLVRTCNKMSCYYAYLNHMLLIMSIGKNHVLVSFFLLFTFFFKLKNYNYCLLFLLHQC